MGSFERVRNIAGVYLLVDLDEQPLYAGRSHKVRSRLHQHFVRQDSSATADGLLDLYDVLRVYVWYCEAAELEAFEAAVHATYTPRWCRGIPSWDGALPKVQISTADVVVGILDRPERLAVRREPFERIEAKLLHPLRAVRKAKISGASPSVRDALHQHARELIELIERDSHH